MAKLPLHGGQVAGFLDQMFAHGVAGGMRGVTFNLGKLTGLVPDGVNHFWAEPAVAVRRGGRRKKQSWRLPSFLVLFSFLFNIILLVSF